MLLSHGVSVFICWPSVCRNVNGESGGAWPFSDSGNAGHLDGSALQLYANFRRVQEPRRKPRKDTSRHGFESSSCIVLCEESSRVDNVR